MSEKISIVLDALMVAQGEYYKVKNNESIPYSLRKVAEARFKEMAELHRLLDSVEGRYFDQAIHHAAKASGHGQ